MGVACSCTATPSKTLEDVGVACTGALTGATRSPAASITAAASSEATNALDGCIVELFGLRPETQLLAGIERVIRMAILHHSVMADRMIGAFMITVHSVLKWRQCNINILSESLFLGGFRLSRSCYKHRRSSGS